MPQESADAPADSARLPPLAIMVVGVLAGLLITATVTAGAYQREVQEASNETDRRLVAMGNAIDRQVSGYSETLFGLRADFAREPDLNRAAFGKLVDIRGLTQRNPGATLITFNRLVPREELDEYEARVRSELPGFRVTSPNRDVDHVVIEYVEPFDPDSPALGFDIASEPVRRRALDFARDSGELSASRPVTLVQLPGTSGFLLMLAAYDQSPVPVTAPSRRRHFLGVLVAVFNSKTVLEQTVQDRRGLQVSVYDAGPTIGTPFNRPQEPDWMVGRPMPDYTNFADIDVGSRRWRLVTDSPVTPNRDTPIAVGVSGAALTFLVTGLFWALAMSRRRAVGIATQMTADLRVSEKRLRAANESVRRFLDVAAHDLRTPLTAISGYAELLAEQPERLDASAQQRAVGVINRQTKHMTELIDDLLMLSSIDGDGLVTRPVPVTLTSAIQDCLEAISTEAPVSVTCPPDLVALVDRNHLRRMLENYVLNALKYGEPPIEITARRSGRFVEIRVTDHGSGVPEEFVPRLFSTFARADDAGTQAQRGTGLGLSIVRGLAEANGGTTSYQPYSPRGSQFVVRLPAAVS
jgi:signal transduction histidine kinase